MLIVAITYRLAPEHTFPLPLHDVFVGYLRLLRAPLNIKPENIVIAGDSAGGGLSLALCMYLRDEGYPMPAGLVLMSPWVDLTMSCGSWDENMAWDVVPRPDSDGKSMPCPHSPAMTEARPLEPCWVLSRSKWNSQVPHSSLRFTSIWQL